MLKSTITNLPFKFTLFSLAVLGIAAAIYSLMNEFNFYSFGSLVVNVAILVLYFIKSQYLKPVVKISALMLIISSVMLLLPSGLISIFYGGETMWLIILGCIVLIVIGIYIFKGSNSYIQIEEIDE